MRGRYKRRERRRLLSHEKVRELAQCRTTTRWMVRRCKIIHPKSTRAGSAAGRRRCCCPGSTGNKALQICCNRLLYSAHLLLNHCPLILNPILSERVMACIIIIIIIIIIGGIVGDMVGLLQGAASANYFVRLQK